VDGLIDAVVLISGFLIALAVLRRLNAAGRRPGSSQSGGTADGRADDVR
jgi:hypothetical protein